MATTFFGINLQQLRGSIVGALSYWAVAMRSILPAGMRARLMVGEEQLVVRLADEQLLIEKNVNGAYETVAVFAYVGGLVEDKALKLIKKQLTQDSDLILQVADEVVLSKPIGFPAAVADNLRQTLLYEMDKHTPFAKEDVLFDVDIEHRQETTIQARLYILHRNQVASILAAFEQTKIRFDQICTRGDSSINLLPQALRRRRAVLPRRNLLLGILWLLLLAVVFAAPLYFKRSTAIKLEQQMAVLSAQAEGEGELWEKRDTDEQTILAFIDAYPMPFSQIYEELNKRLPDDTWVNNLVYQNGKIVIRGEGKDVAGLIALINASPLFKNARIRSPIVKAHTARKEIYHISFEIVTNSTEATQ